MNNTSFQQETSREIKREKRKKEKMLPKVKYTEEKLGKTVL